LTEEKPCLGVIEGFYGQAWTWSERTGYADFLAQSGYSFYIYAPKSDACLRHEWKRHWPVEQWDALHALRSCYRDAGVLWGIGLSPFEIYKDWTEGNARLLDKKLLQINELFPDILCVLFDDMSGDKSGLASLQAEIVEAVIARTNAKQIIVCPTYYSFDPVLEKLFGPMPDNYWQVLGELLPENIDIFWTGDSVCSSTYEKRTLQFIADQFQRKPFIWDNYPVNDGRLSSQYLHVDAFRNRPAQMLDWCSGHAVNPMNAAHLSKIPLLTLIDSYRSGNTYAAERAWLHAAEKLCGSDLAALIYRDLHLFQSCGLDSIAERQKKALLREYQSLQNPCAHEICHWLQGHYRFDPACLTG
jgi:hypothetical protein